MIDQILDEAFTPERIVAAFLAYKRDKWDHLSGMDIDNAVINIRLGVDGVTWEAFEKQLSRNASNISRRIREGKYLFHPFREIDVLKDPSKPPTEANTRRLGVASVRDALVQKILYTDVLYEPAEALFRELDLRGPVSYAYRRGKSTATAALRIHSYIADGYTFVYDADLSKFFDSIPHDPLLKKVCALVGGEDSRTYALVRRFVSADRTPYASYEKAHLHGRYVGERIFCERKPCRERRTAGVVQGGTLSGLLANLYLHNFDYWLMSRVAQDIDLRYVRYADDFVIFTRDWDSLELIGRIVPKKLQSDEFLLAVNPEKTCSYDIRRHDLEFVGYQFDGKHIRVREKKIEVFQERFRQDVLDSVSDARKKSSREALKYIVCRANYKIKGVSRRDKCPECGCDRVGPPRSWIAAFRAVTDDSQLRELDKWIRESIYEWMYQQYKKRLSRADLTKKPCLHSLVDEVRRVRKANRHPCLCDINGHKDGVWAYAHDLYEGRQFTTLGRRMPFSVPYVDGAGLQVSVGGNQHRIKKETMTIAWTRLLAGETVTRAQLEQEGIKCTSQVVALLAELPAVEVVTRYPISLHWRGPQQAPFLQLPDNLINDERSVMQKESETPEVPSSAG